MNTELINKLKKLFSDNNIKYKPLTVDGKEYEFLF